MSIAQTQANKAAKALRHLNKMRKQDAKVVKRVVVVAPARVVEKKEGTKGMQTISIATAIRNGFEAIQVKAVKNMEEARRIAGIVHDKLATNVGYFKRPAVSLNVTTRTFKQMVKDGIIVNQAA